MLLEAVLAQFSFNDSILRGWCNLFHSGFARTLINPKIPFFKYPTNIFHLTPISCCKPIIYSLIVDSIRFPTCVIEICHVQTYYIQVQVLFQVFFSLNCKQPRQLKKCFRIKEYGSCHDDLPIKPQWFLPIFVNQSLTLPSICIQHEIPSKSESH